MKDFFSTAKFKILVALAVVLAGMMAWAGANNRLTSAPQELLGAAAVPFQKIGALLSEGVSGVVTKYAEYDSIVEENEQLKQENYDLRQQLVDYDKLKAENEAFRDLNNIREQNPEFEYASAFVIGRDPLDQFGGFTVDAGTLDNVKKGDVVVSDKGYLVVENINNPQSIQVFDTEDRLLARYTVPEQVNGYEYEFAEAARCITEGKPEADSMPHADTIEVMELMDSLRKGWGIVYPQEQ